MPSPLAGGQLTDRYLNGIPEDSRAASGSRFLKPEQITADKLEKVRQLNELAARQAKNCLRWRSRVLRNDNVTSVLIGASKPSQIEDAVGMLANRRFRRRNVQKLTLFWRAGFSKNALLHDLRVKAMKQIFTAL